MSKEKSNDSLLKNPSTRLRFSIWVIIANFLAGIFGMVLGADLTALGVFLSLSNAPLYIYILGRSYRGSSIPKEYFNQPHTGAGGLGDIVNSNKYDYYDDSFDTDYEYRSPFRDGYNIPTGIAEKTDRPKSPNIIEKNADEIG
jgi:hypothetical protein